MASRGKGRRADARGRSKYDPHVRLHKWLLKSRAWDSLDAYARAALVELYARYNGSNNGQLSLSVRELARSLHIAPRTATKALRALEERGFIRPHQRGSFSWKVRHATTWVLAEFPFAGQPPSTNFMRWQPPPENQNTVSPRATVGVTSCNRASAPPPQKQPHGDTSCNRDSAKRRLPSVITCNTS